MFQDPQLFRGDMANAGNSFRKSLNNSTSSSSSSSSSSPMKIPCAACFQSLERKIFTQSQAVKKESTYLDFFLFSKKKMLFMRVLSMSNFASNPPHHSPSQSFDRANADKFMQELKEKAEQAVHDMPGGFG